MSLFFHSGPSAISRFIIAVWINSVQRHTARLFAHVGKEVSKIKPSFANSYPTTAPIGVARVLGICAAGDHSRPSMVCWRDAIGRVSVAIVGICFAFFDAATRARYAATNYDALESFSISTFTFAKPAGLTLFGIFGAGNNFPSSEALPGQINGVHTLLYMV